MVDKTQHRNEYEELFVSRCLQQNDWLQERISVMDKHFNYSLGGLCPLVEKVMLDDLSTILPESVEDVPSMLRYARSMVAIATEGCEIMLGCAPEYYDCDGGSSMNRLSRMEAITAIWLTMFTRCTKKTPYKDMYAYLRRLQKLQWCLLRMFFYYYYEWAPDPISVRVWKMILEKYGASWHNIQMYQKERVEVFLDILHMYSFEYYPPYSKGIFGQRGEYQGQ